MGITSFLWELIASTPRFFFNLHFRFTHHCSPVIQIRTILVHSGHTSDQSHSPCIDIDLPQSRKSVFHSRPAECPWDHSYMLEEKTDLLKRANEY